MTVQDLQRASDEVRELLTKSYDLKLQRGGTADATQFASTAFEKASDLPRTWSHWRQLAAYRLAHLLLRQDGPLDEIDTFLSIAEGADFLEPLRSFCHLAVLHRIRACQKTAVDRKAVTARIETAFSIATGYVQQAATRPSVQKSRRDYPQIRFLPVWRSGQIISYSCMADSWR